MNLTAKQVRSLAVFLSAAIIAVLNQTLLSPAYPVIMADMNIDAPTAQWLTSGYAMTEAVIIPLSAFLMGRFGARKLLIGGLCIFLVGTLTGAFAPVFGVLLFGRVLQASSTAYIMTLMFTCVLLIFPPEKRGMGMGFISLVIGVAPAAGPPLSGVLIETVGWRWVFGIIAIIVAVIIVCAIIWLPEKNDFEKTTFDKISVGLCGVGLLALLYGLSSVTSTDNIIASVLCMAFGIGLIGLFVKRQGKLAVPFLKVDVLKIRDFRIAVLIEGLFMAALVGVNVLLPIFLQTLIGVSPLQTGLIMLPAAVLGAIAALVSGMLYNHVGARVLAIPGAAVCVAGGVGMSLFGLDSSILMIGAVYTLACFGWEFCITPIDTWGFNALKDDVLQHGTTILNTTNQIAASLGTAVMVSLTATSALIYPDANGAVQQMEGMRLAFMFTALMMILVLVISVLRVRDRKSAEAANDE